MSGREFFSTVTVTQALDGFRPVRRTQAERVRLDEALGRVPAASIVAPSALPGFARSTVDGYAIWAADTYGASDGLPVLLEVLGAVSMGQPATVAVTPGGAVEMPTGGVLPAGADAVAMVEHTAVTMPGTVEVSRPVAPGEGIVGADEDVAGGGALLPAGRALRPPDLALLAAAGVVTLEVHARPRVAIVSTGDEVVPPSTVALAPGQVRDATASGLAGQIRRAGGEPVPSGIVADEPGALQERLANLLATGDLDMVVVSAGSSVGARDETASAVSALGEVWCHGIAVKPGKPTLLAECAGIPVVGLPGNPLSALVVFGLLGTPLVWRLGGCATPTAEPTATAVLGQPIRSAAGRLDVVQVTLADGVASPLFGPSALLSRLTAADGHVVVAEPLTGLDTGTRVEVILHT